MERKAVLATMMALLLIGLTTSFNTTATNGTKNDKLPEISNESVTQNVDSWPMYLHDLNRTGYSTVKGPKTNQTRWTYTTGNSILSHPSVADGMVFIGSNDWNFYALNETNGALIWKYTTGGIIFSGSAVSNGIVYTGSQDYKVYALNETTGTLIWNYTTGHQIYSSSPAVANGIVYIGSRDYKLYALNATTGVHIWNYTTSGEILSSPTVVGGIVYIGSRLNPGSVYALNATTGNLIWQYNTGGIYYSSPVISGGVLYVGTAMASSSKLYALNASTGSLIWYYPSVGSINTIINSAAVAYGMVYFGCYDYYFYALNKTSGSLIWRYYMGYDTFAAPAVADGVVYIGDVSQTSTPAKFHAVNASTGDRIWTYQTGWGNYIQSSAAIADGMVFVGATDRKVYAFGDFHGVAVTDVLPGKTIVGKGYESSINVTVENKGFFAETFNVTAYANETIIATITNITLTNGTSKTVAFAWNTTGFAKGNYTIWAYAWPVEDEDTYDNTFTDGTVLVTIPGDVNGDKKVDGRDIALIAKYFGSASGYPPNADINDDGKIDGRDIAIAAKNFGQIWT